MLENKKRGKPMNPQIGVSTLLLLLALLSMGTKAAPQSAETKPVNKPASATCPVTLPRQAPNDAKEMFGAGSADWNGDLFVGGIWPDGTIVFQPGGPGFILPDGSLSMKFGWFRTNGLRGKLTIHGKRLDASAPPLRANIPECYPDTGFQATGLIFPTEGCWEVTGQVGNTSLTFVTRVVHLTKPANHK